MNRHIPLLFGWMLMPLSLWAQTPLEKLCQGYQKQQQLIEKKLRQGAHAWEKRRMQAQLEKLQQRQQQSCKGVKNPPGSAS